jgi:hypothetical protein
MRTLLAVLTAAALGVSSAFLVACGDRNDLIPGGDAASLQSDLDSASDACARKDQGSALAAVGRAQSRAGELPSSVDAALRKTLNDNLDVVRSSVASGCKTQTTQTTQSTATTPTTTETTPTTTTDTTPTTQTTTTETTTTTTPTPPPTTPEDSGGTPPSPLRVGKAKGHHKKHDKHGNGG